MGNTILHKFPKFTKEEKKEIEDEVNRIMNESKKLQDDIEKCSDKEIVIKK